ncbi:hypothetical protein BO71DRAFT_404465 [Aspergillus ellipticus CBS 707.79]|uniref:Uncharacterized protein n=1 Tax=Aspergillus ellipticus CBS 707.79 TaxID=1448320 RepID=A0A319CTJ1_9EURO|nr:hypothetical protein BO71DRAFT_404465 [Aspergillus ellipticus CBS 707.79]
MLIPPATEPWSTQSPVDGCDTYYAGSSAVEPPPLPSTIRLLTLAFQIAWRSDLLSTGMSSGG